ncbi:hypothetical protein BST97_00725 [Nonlabens spongiae]|uniref:Outer membrane protein beta-barrel domain-containing protein n=1 Tax=Nonlabens spongiae TaxID=331648 RepID=A0A1W6MGB3_9FLAO|nr:hypothetical protein [Nonlabens spongiae]ARN76644.1 hypothetical protein BST97_00725 [Nonlabens spongiae]
MKKIFTTVALVLTCFISQAQVDQDENSAVVGDQDFAIGGMAALPIGDPADFADYGLGVELMYLKSLFNGNLNLGGTVGYSHYVTDKDVNLDDAQFLPIALTGLYPIGDLGFGAGLDVGYAIGINDGNNGGFLYEPKAYLETSRFIFSLGYRGIVLENDTFDTIKLGFAVKLN